MVQTSVLDFTAFSLLLLFLYGGEAQSQSPQYDSGCADGSTEGFQDERHPKIAACQGQWQGHIRNASGALCGAGWRLCGWYDGELMKSITWEDATSLQGCYAFNAAQDGGDCRECREMLEQDDLAGVGRGCPHQTVGQKSCISGGRIDASCCVDSHFRRACSYRPGLATGILCCKMPAIPPKIIVHPKERTHVLSGVTFVLSCQASGSPPPLVTWYKNSYPLPSNISRISVLDSGYLLISQAAPSDTGQYTCMATNSEGTDSANAFILVTDYNSGCASGLSDGLAHLEGIHACEGSWTGHVKRGKSLCARGWHVCSPRHHDLIRQITMSDIEQLDGCYAYNAMNTRDGCYLRCHRRGMAGIGNRCGRIRRHHKSCLAQGRVDVFRSKSASSCSYTKGATTGVLCCRKRRKSFTKSVTNKPSCSPECMNGGVCVGHNRCDCRSGYKGAWCQHPICPNGCVPHSVCIKPHVCMCRPGYVYKTGKCKREEIRCKETCLNGGRCRRGKCKCPKTHYGSSCQHIVRWRILKEKNRTER